MREHLRILTAKEVRGITKEINEHFSSDFSTEMVMLENNKNRIFILSRDYGRIDETKLRINNMGLYFCTREKDGFRLSIEGSQLINATKNVYNTTKEQAVKWISGENINTGDEKLDGYVIVRYNGDTIGCGKSKNEEILNAVPKDRRIASTIIIES